MNVITSNLQGGTVSTLSMPVLTQPPAAERQPLIQQYLRIALRWKYVIIGVTITCLVLGIVATLLMTPKYTATATVEIARDSNQVTNFQGVERDTTADRPGVLPDPIRSSPVPCLVRTRRCAVAYGRRPEFFYDVRRGP